MERPLDGSFGDDAPRDDMVRDGVRSGGSLRTDLLNVVRGFCMGAADVVPGVSGGTVALVLGHYQQLVTAISRFDATALRLVLERRWKDAFTHVDARFLMALALGVATGILGLASAMHWLLEHRHAETMAVFFGLVLASGLVVGQMIHRFSAASGLAALLGGAVAWIIGTLSPVAAEPTVIYLFFSACLAICAMILPGISGAFVLLLLGAYHPVMGMIKDVARGEITLDVLMRLGVFALGCAIGLGMFSRVLRVLLERYRDLTFAALLGLMIGSLGKLWPLQIATSDTAHLELKDQVYIPVSPDQWPQPLWPLVVLAMAAVVLVLVLNHLGRAMAPSFDTSENPTDARQSP